MKYLVILSLLLSACGPVPPTTHEVRLEGEITKESADLVIEQLKAARKASGPADSIRLLINSGGGSVEAGLRVVEEIKYIQANGVQVITTCTAECYSMAAIILMFGSVKEATSTATIMFHHIYYSQDPSYRDKYLVIRQHSFLEEMAEKMKVPEIVIVLKFAIEGDLFYSARDAKRLGFIDRFVTLEL